MPKKRTYYFYDEINDDFANTDIEQKGTPPNWKYLPKSKIYNFFNVFLYYPITILCKLIVKIMGVNLVNKKIIKQAKKQGCFIYSNHTSYFLDAVTGHIACFPKKNYIVVNPDAINITGIRWVTKGLGALPIPQTKNQFISFIKAIDNINKKKNCVTIYPEAHIWPKYNKIRPFSSVSFSYPAKLNAPCFIKTTVYKTTRNGKTKPVIYFDGPFYPNMELQYKERQQDLRNKIYNQMQERAKDSQSDINFTYKKVYSKEEVKVIYK